MPGQAPYFNAGFSEYYYLLPGHVCVKLPDDLSDAVAAPINCALAQVIQALDSGGFRQGDSLVVQGAGGLGLNMIAAARDMGAGNIIAVDGIPGRLKLAKEFGADHTVDIRDCPTPADRIAAVKELTNGMGATHAADVAGVKGVVAEGIEMLAPGGTYLEIGSIVPGVEFAFDPDTACRRGLHFIGFLQYDTRILPRAHRLRAAQPRALPVGQHHLAHVPAGGHQRGFRAGRMVRPRSRPRRSLPARR